MAFAACLPATHPNTHSRALIYCQSGINLAASRKLACRVETNNGLAIFTNAAGIQVDLEAIRAIVSSGVTLYVSAEHGLRRV